MAPLVRLSDEVNQGRRDDDPDSAAFECDHNRVERLLRRRADLEVLPLLQGIEDQRQPHAEEGRGDDDEDAPDLEGEIVRVRNGRQLPRARSVPRGGGVAYLAVSLDFVDSARNESGGATAPLSSSSVVDGSLVRFWVRPRSLPADVVIRAKLDRSPPQRGKKKKRKVFHGKVDWVLS